MKSSEREVKVKKRQVSIRALIGEINNPMDKKHAWMARALEINISGFGSTPEKAWKDLRQLIGAQIAFAYHTNTPEILDNPAEDSLFELWEKLHQAILAQDKMRSQYSAKEDLQEVPQVVRSDRLKQEIISEYATA